MSTGIINILMTGAGAPGAAGIIRCLQSHPGIQLTVADANPDVVGRYLANDFVQIPPASSGIFVDTLISICRERNIHAVIPLVTRELIPLASRVTEFELAGSKVIVSPASSLEIANNKSKLYQFLEWRSIHVPAYRIVETIGQFNQAISDLGYPNRPICFKPSVSNGSRGFRIIDPSIDEAKLLFNEKPNTTYITLHDAVRILSSAPFPELLVSEYLPGDEYSVDCLANHGETIIAVPRIRTKMINGISVQGEFVNDTAIIAYAKQIISELQLHGNIGIQAKRNVSGEAQILEINPRVQGTISAGLGAGINLPLLAVKLALDIPIAEHELEVKWGTRFLRFWSEVFY